MIGSLTGPTSLERFVDLAVPELQRRDLFHTDYAKGTLRTLGGPPLRAQAGERRIVAMIDFHTHWIPSGLPDLADLAARSGNSRWPVFDQPTGRLMISGEAVRALPASGWDVQVRLDAMDAAGVARHVLSPVPPLLCDWAHPKPGTEWATAINDSLAEAVRPIYTDSVVYRPPCLRYLVDTLGAGHVCFGADYPLPVHADPAGSIVDSLDRAEAAWVREGTASALLSLQ